MANDNPPAVCPIYVDNHLLVVDKPAGALSQGDSSGAVSLLDAAKAWLKTEFDKPGNVYLGLVHRLDRPVCGVMVFARTSKAAARLSDQLRRRQFGKVYEAVVHGDPPASATLEDELDGRECRLDLVCLERRGALARLEIRPATGRKHQIRRQLAAAGYPIVGDVRYGGPRRPLPDRAIALRSRALTLEHPTRKEALTFEADAPGWWPW